MDMLYYSRPHCRPAHGKSFDAVKDVAINLIKDSKYKETTVEKVCRFLDLSECCIRENMKKLCNLGILEKHKNFQNINIYKLPKSDTLNYDINDAMRTVSDYKVHSATVLWSFKAGAFKKAAFNNLVDAENFIIDYGLASHPNLDTLKLIVKRFEEVELINTLKKG